FRAQEGLHDDLEKGCGACIEVVVEIVVDGVEVRLVGDGYVSAGLLLEIRSLDCGFSGGVSVLVRYAPDWCKRLFLLLVSLIELAVL
ncbi:hypothetical protein RA272_29135, partial [Pseudomonas syringae pv. tagetis]|uniref:hypothetical protein n=1 Tax=Pseudomonas syringae group genomosp. 7 TaxID=251699 RepID=UPI00376F5606